MMAQIPHENAIAAEMYEAACRERGEARDYLGMSGIGDPCARKLWLSFRGYDPLPLDGRAAMIFDLGSRVEEAVLHWLEAAGYRIEGQQQDFSAHEGFFRGHCDGIIYGVTERAHILEIKSANDKKFQAFKAKGIAAVSPTYYAQVQCYMGFSGLERALWVVMNKNTCEIYTERCHFSRDDFEALRKKALDIICALDMPAKTEGMCEWCEQRSWCNGTGMQTRKTCGTCTFLDMGLKPRCRRHDVELKRWGASCPDWMLCDPHCPDMPF